MGREEDKTWLEGLSPGIQLLKVRYRQAGLFRWDNARVTKLCNMIPCHPRELCALAGVFNLQQIDRYFKFDKWPVQLAIHFRRIEEQVNKIKFPHEADEGPGIEDIELARIISR